MNAASAFKFTDKSLAPDMNAALRMELVQYLTYGIEALSDIDQNSVRLRPAKFNRKSNWLQKMLHGDHKNHRCEDSATESLTENDHCVTASTKDDVDTSEIDESPDADDYVKVPMCPSIKSQDSSAFVLTEAKGQEPFTATMENLFENHFRRIRNIVMSTKEYNKSLRQINPGKETAGRSGAFLFKTRDQRLILKTVTETELEVLRSLLKDPIVPASMMRRESVESPVDSRASSSMTYTEYMEMYGKESLIMKIIGCFRLTLHEYGNESKTFIVCMNVSVCVCVCVSFLFNRECILFFFFYLFSNSILDS